MSKFFDFVNEALGSNKIFSKENVGAMSVSEFSKNKKALLEQDSKIGIPSNAQLESSDGAVHVSAYTRDDGTQVSEHWRSKPAIIGGLTKKTRLSGKILKQVQDDSFGGFSSIVGVPTGAAAPMEKLTKKRDDIAVKYTPKQVADLLGKNFTKYYKLPHSFGLYNIASPDPKKSAEYIKANGRLLNSTRGLNNSGLERSIKDRLRRETGISDCKVMVYNHASPMAGSILQSNEFQRFLKENSASIKQNGKLADTKITFTSGDMYNSLHGAEIKDINVDSKGNLHLKIGDLYNFNPDRTSVRGRLGERYQNEGSLENFYILVPMVLSKNYWQNL